MKTRLTLDRTIRHNTKPPSNALRMAISCAFVLSISSSMVDAASPLPLAPAKAFTIELVPNLLPPAANPKAITAAELAKKSQVDSKHKNALSPAMMKENTQNHGRSIQLRDGGVIWLSKDASALKPRLDINTAKNVVLSDSDPIKPVSFAVTSNYSAFIKRWELSVYKGTDDLLQKPVAVVKADKLPADKRLSWDGRLQSGRVIKAGDTFQYVLRVYDQAGNSDETRPQTLQFVASSLRQQIDNKFQAELLKNTRLASINKLVRQTIPVQGSRVRLYGQNISEGTQLAVNGENITIDSQRRFAKEYLLPIGKHDFKLAMTHPGKAAYQESLQADLDGQYLFMVGLADVMVGKGKLSGNIEPLANDERYFGNDIFVDGRLAFYAKGKIKGKYLVTAQMDTGMDDIEHIFDDFLDKDPRSVFRRLDPDQYYPVYGDDSTLTDDTDSQGKLYVRVDWDKSRGIWGNYNTALSGNEFARFNRSLYGAKLDYRSPGTTQQGDHRQQLTAFAAEAESAFSHNQFLATGGSLYYLKHTDIVDGSDKIWVEIRQRESERVVKRIELKAGRDYDIDDFQGRILLKRPLQSISAQSAPSIIKDEPLEGNDVYLMVDYEYVPDNELNQATYGLRGKQWLTDNIAVAGTWAHENRDNQDYDIKGVDVTFKKNRGTYLKFDLAQSEAIQTDNSFISQDGGLNFTDFNKNALSTDSNRTGKAIGVEARAELADIGIEQNGSIGAWYKQWDKDFSIASLNTEAKTTDTGLEAELHISDRFQLTGRATSLEKTGIENLDTTSFQADYRINDRFSFGGEVRHVNEENLRAKTSGKGTLVAAKLGYDFNQDLSFYLIGQGTVSHSGSYRTNDLFTIGARASVNSDLTFNAEYSDGDRGQGATLGVDYKLNDSYSLYSNYKFSTDSSAFKRDALVLGQRKSITSALKVFSEHQFTHEDDQVGLGHTFGLDYQFSQYTTATLSLQKAKLTHDDDEGDKTDRLAISGGFAYKLNRTLLNSKLEYRVDKRLTDETEQWVSTNRINYQFSPSTRLQGKLNHSVTDNKDGILDARFTEAGMGFAYRPVSNDRLNVLGRATYLNDLQPASQSNKSDEKSTIFSLEASYQLDQRWEIGGKLAHRESKLREDRDIGNWLANDASLAATRVRYHLNHQWDGMMQYQWIVSDASQDNEGGVLLSLDRHINQNLKVGVGYNFTNYRDDLRDSDGDAKGWFFNIVGKY